MEIKYANADRNTHEYSFVFEGVRDQHQVRAELSFFESWFFLKEDSWDNFHGNISCSFVGDSVKNSNFIEDQKYALDSIPVYMPDALGRYMFKFCLEFFISKTGAPIKVDFVNHPGFPLIVVTHNNLLVDGMVIEDLISKIIDAISCAEIHKELINKTDEEIEEEDDKLENTDDAEIIDYEFNLEEFKDKEVVSRLNESSEDQYTPLEREDEND